MLTTIVTRLYLRDMDVWVNPEWLQMVKNAAVDVGPSETNTWPVDHGIGRTASLKCQERSEEVMHWHQVKRLLWNNNWDGRKRCNVYNYTHTKALLDVVVTHWLNTRVTHMLNTQVTNSLKTQINQRLNTQVTHWFNTQVTDWFNTQVIHWFNTQVTYWLNTQVTQWFNVQVNPIFNTKVSYRLNRLTQYSRKSFT